MVKWLTGGRVGRFGKWRRKPEEGDKVGRNGKMVYPVGSFINGVELISAVAARM